MRTYVHMAQISQLSRLQSRVSQLAATELLLRSVVLYLLLRFFVLSNKSIFTFVLASRMYVSTSTKAKH